jgi:DNA modification methylase
MNESQTTEVDTSNFKKSAPVKPGLGRAGGDGVRLGERNGSGSGDRSGKIEVIYRSIEGLKSDPGNPRVHSTRQVRQLARSVDLFGFNVPVAIDSDGKVIAGHGRIMAARLLGWTEVPTVCLSHLSEAQARAYRIADNRLTEISTWDEELLAKQLKDLAELDLDFSLEATGFEMGEIDLRIEQLSADPEGEPDPADNLSGLSNGPRVSRPGDLWLLRKSRVYCGNALEPSAYATLMDGESADAVFTDPPYNVRISGNVSGLGTVQHREFAMASGEMTESEFTGFLTKASSLLACNSVDGSLHFVCMDWRHLSEILAAGKATYTEFTNLCVWAKDNAGMGSFYRSHHELIFVFKNGSAKHRNNVQLGRFGRNRTNVWRYPSAHSLSRSGDEGNLLAMHPTVKPVAMIADAIMDCTARRDIVLDGFLGSGSTVIAAERTARRCYGLELDPLYIDTIVRRWQAFTRDSAQHAASGRSFDQVEAEVRSSGERQ